MIQRIQTLFLLAASGIIFTLFCTKFAYTPTEVMTYMGYRPFKVLAIVSFLVAFSTIFCFKNRPMQMRLCIYDTIILLALQAWVVYLIVKLWGEYAFSLTCVFPLVAALLILLAFKFISRDEVLVRASSSLRNHSKNRKK